MDGWMSRYMYANLGSIASKWRLVSQKRGKLRVPVVTGCGVLVSECKIARNQLFCSVQLQATGTCLHFIYPLDRSNIIIGEGKY